MVAHMQLFSLIIVERKAAVLGAERFKGCVDIDIQSGQAVSAPTAFWPVSVMARPGSGRLVTVAMIRAAGLSLGR